MSFRDGFGKKKGDNIRNKRCQHPNKIGRQQRALVRQAESANRTPEQQIKRLDDAGLDCKKERAKLKARIEARNKNPKKEEKEAKVAQ